MRVFFRGLILCIVLISLFTACPKTDSDRKTGDDLKITKDQKQGYILYNNLGIWKEENNTIISKTDWLASMMIGEAVEITGQSKDITWDSETSPRNMTPIKLKNGKKGWVSSPYLGVGGTLAVVLDEKAQLFTFPEVIKITSQYVSRGMVCMIKSTEEESDFVQLFGWNPVNRTIYSDTYIRYIKKSAISTDNNDVQAAIFLTVAGEKTKKEEKELLLKEAINQYSNSAFANDLVFAINALDPQNSIMPQTESVSLALTCKEIPAKVYAKPFVDSEVLGEVSALESVIVMEGTKDKFKIGTVEDKWYRIENPVSGWIFGGDFTE